MDFFKSASTKVIVFGDNSQSNREYSILARQLNHGSHYTAFWKIMGPETNSISTNIQRMKRIAHNGDDDRSGPIGSNTISRPVIVMPIIELYIICFFLFPEQIQLSGFWHDSRPWNYQPMAGNPHIQWPSCAQDQCPG
jgi:hypothetical protein